MVVVNPIPNFLATELVEDAWFSFPKLDIEYLRAQVIDVPLEYLTERVKLHKLWLILFLIWILAVHLIVVFVRCLFIFEDLEHLGFKDLGLREHLVWGFKVETVLDAV